MSNNLNTPKLRFHSFVDKWKSYQLGDFLTFKNGINADKEKYGSGVKFINVLDIIQNDFITHDVIEGSVEVYEKEITKNEVSYGDILFQRSSETREEVGQSNVYLDEVKTAVFGGFVIRGKSIGDRIYSPKFINNLLKTSSARKEIITKSGGSTRFNVGQDTLSKVSVTFPSLPEQEKIASFLSSVDKKIEQLNKKKELLEQYKKGVLQKIFKQEIRFKQDNGSDFPDWQVKKLGEVLDLQVREIPKPTSNYTALGVRSHVKGTFLKHDFDPKTISMDKLFIVNENDLVVNITFAWEGAIAVAKDIDDGALVSHRFPTYTFKQGVATHRYFKYVILDKRFRFNLDIISPGGAGRNRVLSKKEFIKLKWNFPDIAEQEKIADFLEKIDDKLSLVNNQLRQSKEFKKGLLQQMFI